MEHIRKDIQEFKATNNLDQVIILWTANTERFAAVGEGVNDTTENISANIKMGEARISASTVFVMASILEGSTYINSAPENTFVPGFDGSARERVL